MAGNPFVFLRGAAQLFYADIQAGYLQLPEALYTLPKTRIMGDCHTSNFGFSRKKVPTGTGSYLPRMTLMMPVSGTLSGIWPALQ
ncbi:DUF2252 family protein [Aliamphritea spongicola]